MFLEQTDAQNAPQNRQKCFDIHRLASRRH
uniref:Uncharacterized protein n=1 Tax=Rhizophora mucronata TaxID=61149 RepID=A0A2P2NT20_RHIMU